MASRFDRLPRLRGYTLLELIIVLALIAAIAALSLPAMRGPMDKSELRSAAKELCNRLALARLDAIEAGAAYQFRFEPAGRRFEVARRTASTTATSLPFRSSAANVLGTTVNAPEPSPPVMGDLSDGLSFFGQTTDASSAVDRLLDPLLSEPAADTAAWSTPIVFYPNGRSSDARIRIRGQRGFYVDVTLRGLTGTATAGRLQRASLPESNEDSAIDSMDELVEDASVETVSSESTTEGSPL
ncbi:MAG: prepilin-type N-terminal cleavage/methylation domain-containing protein [Thermoguttaceae bacterium]